ncbi:MAG: MCP four helix bundle domain-containing protein [Crocinitomicaceae bacterium]|nr:MCP four helix bundle domain-containing protein [Crocinitomicaceae bacterium]
MKIQNKLKYVFGSIFVILIVLATNQIDQNNYTKINETSSSIYKDRLIASDILIQLSECFRNLEVSVIIGDSSRQVIDFSQFDKISTLFSKFEETKLVEEEARTFEQLKQKSSDLEMMLKDSSIQHEITLLSINRIRQDILLLAEIQMVEGNRNYRINNQAVEDIELFSKIEFYLLIILAMIIQIIILYKPKNSDKVE